MKKQVKNRRRLAKDSKTVELQALEMAHKTIRHKDWHVTARTLIIVLAVPVGPAMAFFIPLLTKWH